MEIPDAAPRPITDTGFAIPRIEAVTRASPGTGTTPEHARIRHEIQYPLCAKAETERVLSAVDDMIAFREANSLTASFEPKAVDFSMDLWQRPDSAWWDKPEISYGIDNGGDRLEIRVHRLTGRFDPQTHTFTAYFERHPELTTKFWFAAKDNTGSTPMGFVSTIDEYCGTCRKTDINSWQKDMQDEHVEGTEYHLGIVTKVAEGEDMITVISVNVNPGEAEEVPSPIPEAFTQDA